MNFLNSSWETSNWSFEVYSQNIIAILVFFQALIDEKQIDLVATYTATLPPEIQTQTYAYFLEGNL